MKVNRWEDLKRKKLGKEKADKIRGEIEAEVLEMNLRAMRELIGKTQLEVASAAEMAQGEVSRAERREDHLLSTLRRYIKALGGEIEVRANFGDKSVRLQGV